MSRAICSKAFIFFILISVFTSCKEKEGASPNETIKHEVSLDKTDVIPGDVITITTTFEIKKDIWQTNLGGNIVQVSRFDAHTAVLAVPYISSGEKELDLSELGVANKTIRVLTYTPITNVQEKKEELVTDLQLAIEDIQGSAGDKKLLPVLTSLKETFDEEFAKLTPQEQHEVVFILTNLSRNLDQAMAEVKSLSVTKSISLQGKGGVGALALPGIATGQAFVDAALQYKRLIVATVAAVGGSVFAIYAPDPTGISKVLGIAAAALGVKMLFKAQEQIGEVLSLIFDHGGFVDDIGSRRVMNAKISEDKVMQASTTPENVDFYFTKDIPAVNAGILSNYLSFSQAFAAKTHSSYSSVFENTEKLIAAYTFISDKINRISSFFRGTPQMPPYSNPIPAASKEMVGETPFEKLSIAKVSDKDIELSLSSKNGEVVFTTNSTLKVERKFTFDLVYTDKFLGTTNKKTYSALYNGGNPPDLLNLSAGDLQVGLPSQKLPKPLELYVTDKDGQSLEGVKIIWQVKSGNGTLKTTETVTDQFGSTKNEWTLGAEGMQQVKAILRKKVGNEIVDSEIVFNAFWNLNGEWSALEIIRHLNGNPTNVMSGWVNSNTDWRIQELLLTVRDGDFYKFREVLEFKYEDGATSNQTDSISSRFSFVYKDDLQLIRFGGISGYRDYKILSFKPNEMEIEYYGAQPGTPGWSWTLNLWFTGNPGDRVKFRKKS